MVSRSPPLACLTYRFLPEPWVDNVGQFRETQLTYRELKIGGMESMRSAWIMILAGGAMLPALWAQAGKAPNVAADWPMYNRDLAATRFSPLTQINAGNVARLAVAWSYRFRQDANSSDAASVSELTPIVVNGVMYLSA